MARPSFFIPTSWLDDPRFRGPDRLSRIAVMVFLVGISMELDADGLVGTIDEAYSRLPRGIARDEFVRILADLQSLVEQRPDGTIWLRHWRAYLAETHEDDG